MAISIKPAKLYNPSKSHKFMKSMASGGLARFIALEAFVESGRTYQAYKRGGFDEGRERITEEFTGAVFWLGGVKTFNAINDKIGKSILKLKTAKFDIGKDRARDSVANFIKEENAARDAKNAITDKTIAKFKTTKLVISILMANIMIGFVVPKINQAITRYYHRNDNKQQPAAEPPKNQQLILPALENVNMENFQKSSVKNQKDISFSGGADKLMSVAYNLEHNTTWQLLFTDVGTATGRTISARNNNERREILFRDLSSIFFYMFNMPLLNKALNYLETNGKSTSRVEPMNADYTNDLMKQIVKENGGSISADKFFEEIFGKNDKFELPKEIKEQFKDGYMNIEDFKAKISSIPAANTPELISKYTQIAEEMAKLQPAVEGSERITIEQAERVFKGGYLNNPEFMKNLYELNFGTNKKLNIANFLDPFKFISADNVETVDKELKFFVEQIIEKAKKSGTEITEEILNKAVKTNSKLNALNWGAGFAVSALFLSTIIPKLQYWMTKKITGSNEFPGTEEFRRKKAQQEQLQNQNIKNAA